MRHFILLCLLTLGGLLCFVGYRYALISWVQVLKTGVYAHNRAEAIVETLAIVGYTYLAIRFTRSKIILQ